MCTSRLRKATLYGGVDPPHPPDQGCGFDVASTSTLGPRGAGEWVLRKDDASFKIISFTHIDKNENGHNKICMHVYAYFLRYFGWFYIKVEIRLI